MKQFLKDLFVNQSYDENNFFLIAGPCVVESEELLNGWPIKFHLSAKDWAYPISLNQVTAKATEQVYPLLPVLAMKQA